MAQDRIAEQVAGVVTCSNAKGFQLEGHDGWLNLSKFAAGVAAPERGAHVRVGLDKSGFVRTAETVSPIGKYVGNESVTTGTRPDRETAITRRESPRARAAMRASVGPILPPAPRMMMSPGHASSAAVVSARGAESRSSSSCSVI